MSKSLPVLTVGQRGFARPVDLHPHPKLETHPFDAGTLAQMKSTIPQVGVLEELLITPARNISNGRHRWRGAVLAGLATKEVLPYRVVDEGEVDQIILTTLSARKHYSRSAVAYLARPHIEAALMSANERRKTGLKAGESSRQSINRLTGLNGSSFDDVAEMLNVSVQLLKLASKTVQLFRESDTRIEKWQKSHLDELELWEQWQETNGTDASWQRWREVRLLDMGHQLSDPKCAAVIPESFREVYEAKLFSVEPGESMGLGAINKAVGSALVTKGGGRSDLDVTNPGLHLTLAKKLSSFSSTMFSNWAELELDHRLSLATQIADRAAEWPDEVRGAVASKLKKGGRP
jgi:hypothetical protein